MSERLRATGLAKRFAGVPAVDAVRAASLTVAAGETLLVRGPSGAGKTTLLALLGGLLRPDCGSILLDGVDLAHQGETARRRRRATEIGFVFQRGLLLEALTVRENLLLVAQAIGQHGEGGARADALLERLGLAARAGAFPATLSAGECQRAAVARALMLRPAVVLADEPTAHLDAASGAAVVTALRALVREEGSALIAVTHDARLDGIADRVAHMEDGVLRT